MLRLARDIDDADPEVVERWQDVRDRLLAARDRRVRSRPATTRWSPPGTGWRSPRWSSTPPLTGAAESARRGGRAADRAGRPAPGRRPAAPGLPRRRGRRAGRGAGGLRLRRRGVLRGAPAHRRGALARRWPASCSTRRWPASRTGSGGFYDTADDAEQLVARPADPTDNATPSGLSALAAALVAYAALTRRDRATARRPRPRWRPSRRSSAGTPASPGTRPRSAEALLSGPYEIAIVTDGDPAGDPLVAAAHRHAPPGAVVVAGAPDQPGRAAAGRPAAASTGAPTAYVCRGFVCDRPVTTVDELVGQLARRAGGLSRAR